MDKRRTAAALIALSVVLAGALAWGVTENIRRRVYRTRLKSMYERSFFELVGGMDDLEVKLGKLNVSDGAKEDVVLLSELYRQADSAGRELSALPGSQQSMEEVIAFVNRLSEFSGMLTRKVADGGQIEAQDEQQLSNLLDRCRKLNRAVQALSAQEVADVSLRASSEYPAEEQDPYAAFAQPSVPVPSLIYDGAFSQGARTEPRALGKSRVDEQRAMEIAQDFIGRERVLSAQIEQGVEGEIPCWGVAVETKDAGAIHVQVTRQGGKVLLMTAEFSPGETDRTVEECRGSALKFLNERGFENLVPAYYQVGFGMATFNFVPEQDDVRLYPDLIKAQVSLESGLVIGVEANNYLRNHVPRDLSAEILGEQAALRGVRSMQAQSVRLALIPKNTAEVLCYEVRGKKGEGDYLVYLNAVTGRTEEILKIVVEDEGEEVV